MNNLIIRTLTGVAFVAVIVAAIVYSPISFGTLFVIISAFATREFCSIVNKVEGVQTNIFICMFASMLLYFSFFAYSTGYASMLIIPATVFLPYLVTLLYLFISNLYYNRDQVLASWAYTMMSQLYVALPLALLNCIAFIPYPMGPLGTAYVYMYPLAVFLFLWSSDTGAYCVGSMLGRKIPYRLFPSISPNKSWIGSIGGTLLAVVVAVVISRFEPSMTLWQWIGFALVVAVFGTWGDLVESLIKRRLGIKDSGSVLPGHGGWLDRFDSSLLAIPASLVYVYTIWSV